MVSYVITNDQIQGSSILQDSSTLLIPGVIDGTALLDESLKYTFTFQGQEIIDGFAVMGEELVCYTLPTALCKIKVPRAYRYGYAFTQNDLHFGDGTPLMCCKFSLYRIQKGCSPKLVGLPKRKAATSVPGYYYVTGFAGECGQPGLWLVRWCFQRAYNGPWEERDCYFTVVDYVLCPIPGDTLIRCEKRGWD